MTPENLYAMAASYAERLAASDDADALSDAEHTLLAYCYLDSQVEEGGFVQLIAAGFGDYVFANPLADTLRRWGIKATPKVIEAAQQFYAQHGAQIEALADEGIPIETLRAQYPHSEELDAAYYDVADDDMALVLDYVCAHPAHFPTAQA